MTEEPKTSTSTHRQQAIFWLTLSLVGIAFACFILWLVYFRYHESTDDAYTSGDKVNLTTVVAGTPIAFFADNNDLVEEGQLLVLFDDTYYRLSYEKELQTLASTAMQVRQLYAAVEANLAAVEVKAIIQKNAQYDFENRKRLVSSKGVSQEEYTHSESHLKSTDGDLAQAKAQLKMAVDAVGQTPFESHPLLLKQIAVVKEAYYFLKHCVVKAPVTGYVAQRSVQVGQWVPLNAHMLSIIPLNTMWIDANFKETQLAKMRIGQPADVVIDYYGSDVKFKGIVQGIGFGTGSVFAIIPPQNATGNWIKIVQRLPVRITLDPDEIKKYPLRLGLSTYVNVNISNTDLPMIAPKAAVKPVAMTGVFDVDFRVVDQAISEALKK